MATEKLDNFLKHQAKERGLTLRSLSINAGLSPSTVRNIVKRQYQPSLFSLNRLADYLRVKRQRLWQLAGLLDDMDYSEKTPFEDPRLRFHFAQADKLPQATRDLIITMLQAIGEHHHQRTPPEPASEE